MKYLRALALPVSLYLNCRGCVPLQWFVGCHDFVSYRMFIHQVFASRCPAVTWRRECAPVWKGSSLWVIWCSFYARYVLKRDLTYFPRCFLSFYARNECTFTVSRPLSLGPLRLSMISEMSKRLNTFKFLFFAPRFNVDWRSLLTDGTFTRLTE